MSFTSVEPRIASQAALSRSASSEECVDAKSRLLKGLANCTGQGGVAILRCQWNGLISYTSNMVKKSFSTY